MLVCVAGWTQDWEWVRVVFYVEYEIGEWCTLSVGIPVSQLFTFV